MAETRPDDTMATNASASDSDADHTDDSQGSRNPKKRKRNQKISCELCKARKVKCDRAEPSCGWCSKNNRICVYQERKKPGMRIAYVHELEDKVNRLEAVLHSLGRRVEEHIQEHGSPAQSKPSVPYSQPGYTPLSEISRDAISHTTASPNTDSSWQYVVGHRDTPRHLPEPMSVHSVVDIPDPRPSNRPRSYTASTLTNTHNNKPFSIGESDLPPYDLVYNLVDLFFKHVNPWSPILDRKTTFNVLFGGTRLTEDDRVLLNAIVATTLRFSSDQRLTPTSRKQYHDTAKTRVLFHCLSNPSIGSMQALVILAIDTIGTSASLQGMNVLAFLARQVAQLGLGDEKTIFLGHPTYAPVSNYHHSHPSQPPSWIEEEGRRRLVWMLYILDRYTTIAASSTFTLPDNSLHLRLPCTYDLFSRNAPVSTRWPRVPTPPPQTPSPLNTSPAHLGSFSYHCEVLTILSRIHNFLSSPLPLHSPTSITHWRHTYTSLDHSLTTWLHSLPGEYGKISQLCHSDPGSKISNWIMLHAAFVLAVIRLHSVAAYPTSTSPHFTPSYNAMQRCLGAVESLREIAQDTINNSMLDLLGPPFAFSLWTSARLLVVHAATMDCEVDPKVGFFVRTLEEMGAYWEIARTYARTLEWVVGEGSAAAAAAAAGSGGSGGEKGAAEKNGGGVGGGVGGAGGSGGGTRRTFRELRKRSCEINRLLAERREGGWWEQSRVLTPMEGEVEALDVFGFFDYPRVATGADGDGLQLELEQGHGNGLGQDGGVAAREAQIQNQNQGQNQQAHGYGYDTHHQQQQQHQQHQQHQQQQQQQHQQQQQQQQQQQHSDLQHRPDAQSSREGTDTPGTGPLPPTPLLSTAQHQHQNPSSGTSQLPLPPLATLTAGGPGGDTVGGGGLGGLGGGRSGISSSAVSSTMQSPVFAMPTREGDWLNFQPPHE